MIEKAATAERVRPRRGKKERTFGVTIKQVSADDSGLIRVIEGVASVFGNMDHDGDVMDAGAFRKTIAERVPRGIVKLLKSHDWGADGVLGTVVEAEETDEGLAFKAEVSSAPDAQVIALKVKEGHLNRLSIGFDIMAEEIERTSDGRIVRHIKEVRLWEVSIVAFAANEEAHVTGVKAVVPFQDLPLGERDREWDADAAEARVRAWAGAGDGPTEKYRQGFLWYDADKPDDFGSYKLLVADVIDDVLTAIPGSIFAVAGVLEGARDGVDVPDEERPRLRRHVDRYYAKMRDQFDDDGIVAPWNKAANLADAHRKAVESNRPAEGSGTPSPGTGTPDMTGPRDGAKGSLDSGIAARRLRILEFEAALNL